MKDLPESSLTPIFEINLKIYKILVINVTSILENRYIKIIVQNREIYKQTNRQTKIWETKWITHLKVLRGPFSWMLRPWWYGNRLGNTRL